MSDTQSEGATPRAEHSRETPLTDSAAFVEARSFPLCDEEHVQADFARMLERELGKWRAFGQRITGVDANDHGWLRAELESRWKNLKDGHSALTHDLAAARVELADRTRELDRKCALLAELRANWHETGNALERSTATVREQNSEIGTLRHHLVMARSLLRRVRPHLGSERVAHPDAETSLIAEIDAADSAPPAIHSSGETPRTDAALIPASLTDPNKGPSGVFFGLVPADLARTLERDLSMAVTSWRASMARVKALQRLLGCPDNCDTDNYPGCGICMTSTEALATLPVKSDISLREALAEERAEHRSTLDLNMQQRAVVAEYAAAYDEKRAACEEFQRTGSIEADARQGAAIERECATHDALLALGRHGVLPAQIAPPGRTLQVWCAYCGKPYEQRRAAWVHPKDGCMLDAATVKVGVLEDAFATKPTEGRPGALFEQLKPLNWDFKDGHFPFCRSIIRGKDCDCGYDAATKQTENKR